MSTESLEWRVRKVLSFILKCDLDAINECWGTAIIPRRNHFPVKQISSEQVMLMHPLHMFIRSCLPAERVRVSPGALWIPCVHRKQWQLKRLIISFMSFQSLSPNLYRLWSQEMFTMNSNSLTVQGNNCNTVNALFSVMLNLINMITFKKF